MRLAEFGDAVFPGIFDSNLVPPQKARRCGITWIRSAEPISARRARPSLPVHGKEQVVPWAGAGARLTAPLTATRAGPREIAVDDGGR